MNNKLINYFIIGTCLFIITVTTINEIQHEKLHHKNKQLINRINATLDKENVFLDKYKGK
jgi:large-conductance mechanosensitive channel